MKVYHLRGQGSNGKKLELIVMEQDPDFDENELWEGQIDNL